MGKRKTYKAGPIVALTFAAATYGFTGTPIMNNSPISIVGSNIDLTAIALGKREENGYTTVNDVMSSTDSRINPTLNSSNAQFGTSVMSVHEDNIANKNFEKYFFKFIDEVDKHQTYLSISESQAILSFMSYARKISTINHIKSSIDLLPEDGIKFVLKLSEDKLLMASQYLVDTDIPSDNVVFSLFENRKLVESNVLHIDAFVERFSS